MPSTYTSNNKIQKIATGEQSGTWGSTTNTNFDLFDTAIDGFVAVAVTGTTTTLNIPDGSAADGRNKVLSFTGALTAANTVSVTPNTVKKHYFVQNNTTGSQNIIIYQGSGSTVTIKPGYSSVVYLDGAGGSASAKEVLTSLKLTALLEATGAVFVGSTSGSTTLQATATASGTLTLPAATDTLVGKATTDTFTNKTLDTAGTGNVLRINGTQVSAVTGTGSVVLATSPTLVTPAIGTPTSGTLTSCTGLPISTGVSGLGSGVATFLATPSSSNLATAVTDETGSGALVFATSPTLVTPLLGTPTSVTLTNATGLPISTGVSGLGTGVATFLATPSSANLASAVTDETGSGALVFATSPTLVTPLLGTPTSGTLTSCTGLPISTGVSGLGASVATFLATPSSANLAAALTDETGTGANVFATSPTIVTPTVTTSLTVNGSGNQLNLNATSGAAGMSLQAVGVNKWQVYNDGSNQFGIYDYTAAATRLLIGTTGNVGIGTASPGVPLDVNGAIRTISATFAAPTSGAGLEIRYVTSLDAASLLSFNRTTSAYKPFLVDASYEAFSVSGSEKMRIHTDGNVGIGTASPRSLLDLTSGTANSAGDTAAKGLTITTASDNPTSVTAGTLSLQSNSALGADLGASITFGARYITSSTASADFASIFGGKTNATSSNLDGYLSFFTRKNGGGYPERMRIDSDGNVGIGTTTPGATTKLQVSSSTAGFTGIASSLNGTGINYGYQSSVSGAGGANTGYYANVTGASNNYGVRIVAPASGANNYAIYADGTAQSYFAGNVGIGVTNPAYKLEIVTDSAGKPGIGGLWTVTSDERIKTDIIPADLDRCYEIVKSVPLKHFGFAPGVYTDDQINDKHGLGWIAQDVQKVFSKAVSVKPFTLKTAIPDGAEEYTEQDFTLETVEKTETSIQVIDGKPVQVSKVVTSENKVLLFDSVDVVDEAGAVVMDGDKALTYQMPRMVTKTRNKVRHDVIEDCLDLNGGQMIAALYGAVQALMLQVESLKAGN